MSTHRPGGCGWLLDQLPHSSMNSDGKRGETTPWIRQQAELALEEAPLSKDNRNTFFHQPGSGEGSDILGGKKISPLVKPPNRSRGAHGAFARGMLPAQCGRGVPTCSSNPLRTRKGLHHVNKHGGFPLPTMNLLLKCKRGVILSPISKGWWKPGGDRC